jgi:predicted nucleic acid-binding protein
LNLVDAGPLMALLDRTDPHHIVCVAATKTLPYGPLLTTWPCFTEAMHLLYRAGGSSSQQELWREVIDGRLLLHESSDDELLRMRDLMAKYRDLPMDLADASVVAAAETIGQRNVFTLDHHFRIYRLGDGSAFEVVP